MTTSANAATNTTRTLSWMYSPSLDAFIAVKEHYRCHVWRERSRTWSAIVSRQTMGATREGFLDARAAMWFCNDYIRHAA